MRGASLVSGAASQTSRRAAQMTDPYLNLFRGLVPPLLGTIDFTPLLGFFILQFISGTLDAGTADDESAEYW